MLKECPGGTLNKTLIFFNKRRHEFLISFYQCTRIAEKRAGTTRIQFGSIYMRQFYLGFDF